MMEFVFEESPWEQLLKNTGDSISAAQLLTVLEGEKGGRTKSEHRLTESI